MVRITADRTFTYRTPLGTLSDARALLRASTSFETLKAAIGAQLTDETMVELAALSPTLVSAYESTAAPSEETWSALLRVLLRRTARSTPFPGTAAVGVADTRAPQTSPNALEFRHVEMPLEPLDPPEIHAAVPALRHGNRVALLDGTGQVTLLGGAISEQLLQQTPLDAKEDAPRQLLRIGVARRHTTTNGIGRGAFPTNPLKHALLPLSATIGSRLGVPTSVMAAVRERNELLRRLARRGPVRRFVEYCFAFQERFTFEPVRLSTLCLPERSDLPLPWQLTSPLFAADDDHDRLVERLFARSTLTADEVMKRPALSRRSDGAETSCLLFSAADGSWLPDTAPGFFGSAPGCFRTTGRFLAALPELREHVHGWQRHHAATRSELHAEVLCDTSDATAPITRRSHAWPFELVVSGPRLSRDAARLGLDDVWVRARGDSLVLVTNDDREVKVHFGHALNPEQLPTPARLLHFLTHSGPGEVPDFSWGTRENSVFLPRVQCGPHTLSLARWLLAPLNVDASPDVVERWRDEWRVPTIVGVGTYDRLTFINLDAPEGRRELQRHARQSGAFACEVPWLEDDRAHRLFEFVVSHEGRAPPPPVPTAVKRALPEHAADEAFTYYRLTLGDAAQRLLLRQLRDELVELPNWHFVRYVDHGRAELRLRWQTNDDDAAFEASLRERARELGCLSIVTEPYFPERYRYQCEETTDALHAVFHHDAMEALTVWLDAGAGVNVLSRTASDLAAAAVTLWSRDEGSRALRAAGSRPEAEAPLPYPPTPPPFTGVPDSELHRRLRSFREVIETRARTPAHVERAKQSVLHMMCNRRLGPRPDLEFVARGLAHGLLRRHE